MMGPIAHVGAPLAPHDLWGAWNLDPVLLALLAVTVLLYARGVRRLWRSGGRGTGVRPRQVARFAGAIGALAVALVSPLDALSGSLFAAHMVQHLLLALVAAPLLLLGRLHTAVVPLLPVAARRRGARTAAGLVRRAPVATIVVAVGLHVGTLLVWHMPALYDLAVRSPGVHELEHASLVVTALAFWTVMGAARARPMVAASMAAFVASLLSVLLAAALTVAGQPWYRAHLDTTGAWGLTPLEDQQMAAAIMWVGGGMVYLAAAAAAVYRWIRADERERQQRPSVSRTPHQETT